MPIVVVGINNTSNADGLYLNFVSNELLLEMVQINCTEQTLIDDRFNQKPGSGLNVNVINMSGEMADGRYLQEPTQMVIESDMQNPVQLQDNQIMVNSYLADMWQRRMGDKWQDRQYGIRYNNDRFSHMDYDLEVLNNVEVSIVGIFDSQTQKPQIFVSPLVRQKLTQLTLPTRIDIYLKDPSMYEQVKQKIWNEDFLGDNFRDKFDIDSKFDHAMLEIKNSTQSLRSVLIVALLLVLLFAIVSIVIILMLSALSRVYEVAVLRSLGFGRLRVFGLFVMDIVVAFLCAFVVSFALSFVVRKVFEAIVPEMAKLQIQNSLYNVSVIAVSFFAFAMVVIVFASGKMITKKVSTLLKQSK